MKQKMLSQKERKIINDFLSDSFKPSAQFRGDGLSFISSALGMTGCYFNGIGVALSGNAGSVSLSVWRSVSPSGDYDEELGNTVRFSWYLRENDRYKLTGYVS